jgi:serine/threonine protein kinase
VELVNSVLDQFEEDWKRFKRPHIREYLDRAGANEPVVRLVLLRELMASELELRQEESRAHDLNAYREIFADPRETEVVECVLGEVGQAEGASRFRIVRPHAEGGLGEVFVAEDGQLRRKVALKRMKAELLDDQASRARFTSEAQITAYLEHPNIAPIYALGRDQEDLPFYVMRFIEGEPLEHAIKEFHTTHSARRSPGERLLALRALLGNFVALCNAVAFAHSQRVLHRDIKPLNVILGPYGQTMLVDWGLAKVLGTESVSDRTAAPAQKGEESEPGVSTTGSVLGTFSYMSPEQAEPAQGQIGTTSDIYSLGATLYHLLTGRPPFVHKDHEELRRLVIRGEFRAPRDADRTVPNELDAIVKKAMAREPGDRYDSASALAKDIERWLADEPVSAYAQSALAQFRRWCRRNPWTPAFFALLLTAVIAITGLAFWALRAEASTRKERNRAAAVNEFLNKDLLARASPYNQSGLDAKPASELRLITVLDRASETIGARFAGEPIVEASIRQTIGETYQQLGLYPQALPHLNVALELLTRERGTRHPETLIAMNRLGSLYSANGKWADAELLLVPAMEGLRYVLGSDDPESIKAMHDVAELYLNQRKLDEAESLCTQVFERRRNLLGSAHSETLQALQNLAVVYSEQGNAARDARKPAQAEAKYKQAEVVLVRMVDALGSELGLDHPGTLLAKSNLALLYESLGRVTDAARLFDEALKSQRRVLGNNHPETLLTMVRIGTNLLQQRKFNEAEPFAREALDGCRLALDRNHETTDVALAILSVVYAVQPDLDKLGPILIETREITAFRYGPDAELTADANLAVGTFFISKKDYPMAERYLRTCLGWWVKNKPEDWKRVLAENSLCECLLRQRNYLEAKRRLLAAYERIKRRRNDIPSEQMASVDWIAQAAARLYHESRPHDDENDFSAIRSDPVFQSALLNVQFPSNPFAGP